MMPDFTVLGVVAPFFVFVWYIYKDVTKNNELLLNTVIKMAERKDTAIELVDDMFRYVRDELREKEH